MKKLFYLVLSVFLLASCSKAKEVKVTVENPSGFDREKELVELPVAKLKIEIPEGKTYIVKNAAGEVIPSQVTSDKKLIFRSGLKANASETFLVTSGDKQDYTAQVYSRFITERKDDFAWENDRVAFRIYGPALVATDGPSNGIDIWYKRTGDMIIDKWYKNDLSGEASYHEDHGEGLDDYKVGRSLGGGAMAPFINGNLILNENFVSQKILDTGPLRTTFELTYKDLEIEGTKISETRTISLDAGSQYTKIIQNYGTTFPLTVAAGIAKREANDTIIAAVDKNYVIYQEPGEKAGSVFVGLVLPQGMDSTKIHSYTYMNPVTQNTNIYSHILALTTYQIDKPITYYAGYGWTKFGFPTIQDFEKYTENLAKALDQPFRVTYQR